MSHQSEAKPNFGTGIYSFPVAARLVARGGDLTTQTLRYWLSTGLTPSSFGRGPEGSDVLSFYDLISLEIVRLFREEGVSLQRVRKLEARLRDLYPKLSRPFAHEIFFTDGSAIWQQLHPDDEAVIEIIGKKPDQAAWKPAIRSFAKEIRYEGGNAIAWYPHSAVEINPRIRFGIPVLRGTRIPVSTVAAELKQASPAQIASWHGVKKSQVEGVKAYLSKAA